MFAYCGNNPVNNADPSGNAFINVDWDFDGLPNSLFIDVGAGAGYAMAGVANSSGMAEDVTYAAKKAGKAMGGMAKKVGGWIATGAEFLWDAYVRGYNFQQNAQMQEAQMMIDAGNAVFALYMELTMQYESELALLGGIDNVYSGIDNICTGFGRILVPEPTVVNDVIGVGQATYGVIQVAFGLVEIIIWSLEESEK